MGEEFSIAEAYIMKSLQRSYLGHICVSFITQMVDRISKIKAIFAERPQGDLGDKKIISKEIGDLEYGLDRTRQI